MFLLLIITKNENIIIVESNRKLPHLFIRSKTANLVPEFAVEDLPLGITPND